MSAFEAARAVLAKRLRNRAEFWRKKAPDVSPAESKRCHVRAEEADACAEIAADLSPSHAPPDEVRIKRKAKKR